MTNVDDINGEMSDTNHDSHTAETGPLPRWTRATCPKTPQWHEDGGECGWDEACWNCEELGK